MQDPQSSINVQAIEKDGVRYIPLATIVQQLGGTINWDHAAKKASLSLRGNHAEIDVNDQLVRVNGQDRTLTAMPVLENDHVYVTEDFLDQIGVTHQ